MAELLQAKVNADQYVSISEAIEDAVRLMQERDQALESRIEHWVRTEVIPAYERWKADPSKGLTTEQVLASLAEARQRRIRS
jgi:Arc/MetJ-type ribon-helix-helix transcriptional regulator